MRRGLEIVVHDNLFLNGEEIMLRDGVRYVTITVKYELLARVRMTHEVFRKALEVLAQEWYKLHGERLVIVPPEAEGVAWLVYIDDSIDGEVIDNELSTKERRAIDAPRSPIEGRRH